MILMVTVVVLIGLGLLFSENVPQALGQQVQEWKTYREPLQFSIDYPKMEDKVANITKEHNNILDYDMTIIAAEPISTIITRDFNSLMDPLERVVMAKELSLNDTNNVLLQDISTSIYKDKIGYSFATQNLNDGSVSIEIYIQNGGYLYNFELIGMASNPNLTDQFDKILGSINVF